MFIAGRGVRNPGFHTRKGNHKISYFCIKTDKIYLQVYFFMGRGREGRGQSYLFIVLLLWIGYLPVSYTSYKRDKLCHIHVLDNSANKSP